MNNRQSYIGCHMSIRAGYLACAKSAYQIRATAFQYFPKNPRSLTLKSFDTRDVKACAQYSLEKGLLSIAHAPYPTNLAVDAGPSRQIIVNSIRNDLYIAEACGSVGVVVHFGKYKGEDSIRGYKNIIEVLNEALSGWDGKTKLLIENQAGEGTTMGMSFEEMIQIRKLTKQPEHIGFCLDTCHAFASGLWTGENWAEVEAQALELGYWEHLYAIHLNDSVYPFKSYRDRHANIGQGHIGIDAFSVMLQSPYIRNIPIVLETAVGSDGTHRNEITIIQKLLK